MEESKDSASNGAVEVKANEVSSLIEDYKKESARYDAEVLKANNVYSTMVSSTTFNSDSMNLVVDVPIKKPQQADQNHGTTMPLVEETTLEPSWMMSLRSLQW